MLVLFIHNVSIVQGQFSTASSQASSYYDHTARPHTGEIPSAVVADALSQVRMAWQRRGRRDQERPSEREGQSQRAYMLVTNRSEGNAPLTVQGLVEMLRG